jgi:hypothetical protein
MVLVTEGQEEGISRCEAAIFLDLGIFAGRRARNNSPGVPRRSGHAPR